MFDCWHSTALLLTAGISFGLLLLARRLRAEKTIWKRGPLPVGGIAIAAGYYAGLALVPEQVDATKLWLPLAFLLLGVIDDWRTLSPLQKLLGQLVASCVLLVVAPSAGFLGLLWVVFMANSFNLLDNADGVASLTALAIFATLFLVSPSPVYLALAVGVVAFLIFNLPPARFYLGDAGSMFLGSLLAVETWKLHSSSGTMALLLVALPAADTSFVSVHRILHGIPPWIGGQNHLSHQLRKRGFTARGAMLVLVGFQCVALAVYYLLK